MQICTYFEDETGMLTHEQEDEITIFCEDFLRYLLPRRRKEVLLTILFNDDDWEDDAIAYAMDTGDDSADIEINGDLLLPENREYLLETLAHELTHVKQYVTGELREGKSGTVIWKKETVVTASAVAMLFGKPLTEEDYKNQPWEAEAYEKQNLWSKFDRKTMN